MKYKKQIATGALALSLLVGGTPLFAATPQDLGIKNLQSTYQRQNKDKGNIKFRKQDNIIGTISLINDAGFTLDVKNMKTKVTSSMDIKTNALTVYTKDGVDAKVSDLSIGQKVIVMGSLDKSTNILTAKKVKMVTKITASHKTVKNITK